MTTAAEGVDGSERFCGLGVTVRSDGDERSVSHGGSQDGARPFLVVNANTGRAFARMTNYEPIPRDFQLQMLQSLTEPLDQ